MVNEFLKSFSSVLLLALVCSGLVAGTAVGLRPLQLANERLDQKKNILQAAGLYRKGADIEQLFQAVDTRIIRLDDGSFVPKRELNPDTFNQLKAAFDQETGAPLSQKDDLAGLTRLEKYSLVYLVRQDDMVDTIILPIRGKGLWSTMYGYVALSADLSTIKGITFYKHGETPGLGGEIENRDWQAGWRGKKIRDQKGDVRLRVVKGKATGNSDELPYRVDGISGATLTMKGVDNLLTFWFGEHGFKPFLDRYKKQGGEDV